MGTETNFLNKLPSDEIITDDEMSTLSHLLYDLQGYDSEIERLEAQLKEAKQNKNKISSVDIPEFLEEHGLSELKLSDGSKVEVKSDVSVTIKDEQEFFLFLANRHEDAIIKKELKALGDVPAQIIQSLIESEVEFTTKQKIHPMTLKAYFREMLALGEQVPESVKVFVYKQTKIRKPK